MTSCSNAKSQRMRSLPSRGAWIEIVARITVYSEPKSLPSRGAWIEITVYPPSPSGLRVAPLAGSVDRNMVGLPLASACLRSLPSRGAWIEIFAVLRMNSRVNAVAPLAGSVDRNSMMVGMLSASPWSLPSRGAWIEIARRA